MMTIAPARRRPQRSYKAPIAVLAACLLAFYAASSFRRQQRRARPNSSSGNVDNAQMSIVWNTTLATVPYKRFNCRSCDDAANLLDTDAPRAIIAGAMKGGTRSLLTYLSQHPQSFSDQGKETHLLDNRQDGVLFPKEDGNDSQRNETDVIDRCLVLTAYQNAFNKKIGKQRKSQDDEASVLDTHEEHVFFDKSPSYIAFSHVVPQRVLCTFPHAKIILILRNPVDRAYSHFQHCHKKFRHEEGCHGRTFEECVESDLEGLTSAGVLDASTPGEEYEAWVRYHSQRRANRNMMVAKSLYAIQLQQWFAVFRDHFGDEFMKQFLILESEEMHAHKKDVYGRVLDFVGLPQHELVEDGFYHVGDYEPMAKKTRRKLEKFFRPHNRRLQQLLSPFGIEISWAKEDDS